MLNTVKNKRKYKPEMSHIFSDLRLNLHWLTHLSIITRKHFSQYDRCSQLLHNNVICTTSSFYQGKVTNWLIAFSTTPLTWWKMTSETSSWTDKAAKQKIIILVLCSPVQLCYPYDLWFHTVIVIFFPLLSLVCPHLFKYPEDEFKHTIYLHAKNASSLLGRQFKYSNQMLAVLSVVINILKYFVDFNV